MNRIRWVGISCLLLAVCLTSGCIKRAYPSTRNTIETFGDGRYQIVKSQDPEREGVKELKDVAEERIILPTVWEHTSRGDWLYVTGLTEEGRRLFYAINFKTAEELFWGRYQDAPNEHRRMLVRLKRK